MKRLEIKEIKEFSINENSVVSVKRMNHIFEITYLQHKNTKNFIQLLDKDNYVYLPTGEVKICNHIENRSESIAQISQSLKRLRDYINFNVSDVSHCKWLTLTYRRVGENKQPMRDTNKLYKDFKNFIRKFRSKFGYVEYIVACEPQGDGTWHCHCLVIFDKVAPYIANKVIEDLWSQGYTKTQKLDNIDNIGAYLSAYLGDMSLDECKKNNIRFNKSDIKEITDIGDIKLKKPKKFIKGGRLYMYPPKFNLYRISRGIKPPIKEEFILKEIKEKAGLKKPTYSKSIQLTSDDKKFKNIISYEYYNTKRN